MKNEIAISCVFYLEHNFATEYFASKESSFKDHEATCGTLRLTGCNIDAWYNCYCKLCRGGSVCDGGTEHHLPLQHVEIVVNYVVSAASLISMKVDLGNNYVHEVEIFLNSYVAVIYQGSLVDRKCHLLLQIR
jgi:hypothetical protein